MSQSPISPTYSSGAALQRTSARHVRPWNSDSADSIEVAYVPPPPDTDPAFAFIIRTIPKPGSVVQSDVGVRLKDCLDEDFVRAVEHADVRIDETKMFPSGKVVVQRGYFPAETAPPSLKVDIKAQTSDGDGFTWGHLLRLIVREQNQAVVQQDEKPLAVADEASEDDVSPYEHLWIVAIRRSDGADGTIRYFPELEVRMPFD
ncbi:hypothetical protein L226DRAFT_563192 [Lentinus tigrinus ALCF2SS1-7]|uniref:Uncharacterized protein n=1 Tax=Lentinus tigrinus ALCF2SS1-6 TaxID=1328759 RepID=A0A5C2RTL1_9APHY|nr:hypothetical protein L227DRAFT_603751 [Lentinus tigrinus ALCF2SS1-6]RPD69696.1 hypothetical protein L226DRAFT_563192 [Lentinus tigrinus ALCF2SS1-7]